jgi:hypothetical protein
VAPQTAMAQPAATRSLVVMVRDENGVAVASVTILLRPAGEETVHRRETDYAGRSEFIGLESGPYSLHAEKEGFYAVELSELRVGEIETVEVVLNRLQEFTERVDVVYSPPRIDPAQTEAQQTLGNREIVNLPYTTTRDLRYALPLVPGVVQDATGQLHVEGAATHQTQTRLDGFNISHPATGLFDLRVSVDAVRKMEVRSTRLSAEHGKGSGGIVAIETGMGDDRFRFSATNFVPSFQNVRGFALNNWTPRATFSGPLRRGRAWFLAATDLEFDSTILEELPEGADRSQTWRASQLAKAQVNVRPGHLLTTSLVLNVQDTDHAGLSRFDPIETTQRLRQHAWLWTARQQSLVRGDVLFETGVAVFRTEETGRPLGELPYEVHSDGRAGNYFKSSQRRARRTQWMANLTFPFLRRAGRHEFRLGGDVNWLALDQTSVRRPIAVFDARDVLSRLITFENAPAFERHNFEFAAYAQDRWYFTDRVLVELGMRLDWDRAVRDAAFSPRASTSLILTSDRETKLTAGVGLVRDAANMALLALPFDGRRFDLFFEPDGIAPLSPPLEVSFHTREPELQLPRFMNWSLGFERKLPAAFYLRTEFAERRGTNGWAFFNLDPSLGGLFELRRDTRDRYRAAQVSVRRVLKEQYVVFGSYTRSRARSNAALKFTLDNASDLPLFTGQRGGRLAWDAPNRVVSWGWLPFVRGFDLAYSLEWRDGFPFTLVDQDQRMVGEPNTQRLPVYFALNLHLERRLRLLGFQWALRAGFDNITDRRNPSLVNNNVDSPQFRTFAGVESRAFTGRIRFLGRK